MARSEHAGLQGLKERLQKGDARSDDRQSLLYLSSHYVYPERECVVGKISIRAREINDTTDGCSNGAGFRQQSRVC